MHILLMRSYSAGLENFLENLQSVTGPWFTGKWSQRPHLPVLLYACSQPGLHRQLLHWERLERVAAKTRPCPESGRFLLRLPIQSCFKRAVSLGSRMPGLLLHPRGVSSSGDYPALYFVSYPMSLLQS